MHSPDADYNRGNALARLGELGAALDAYDQALAQDPNHTDARYNRALVAEMLERQRSSPASAPAPVADPEPPQGSRAPQRPRASGEGPDSPQGDSERGRDQPQQNGGDGKSARQQGGEPMPGQSQRGAGRPLGFHDRSATLARRHGCRPR